MRFSIILGLAGIASAIPAPATAPAATDNLFIQPLGYVELPESAKQNMIIPEVVTLKLEDLTSALVTSEALPSYFANDTSLEKRGIIGTDNRAEKNSLEYPWSAIGRIVRTDGAIGTAVLVGSRIIVTARHLIGSNVGYTFSPDFWNTDRFTTAQVTTIIYIEAGFTDPVGSCTNLDTDWAVMILDNPLGNTQGYFGLKAWDNSLAGQATLFTAGYPGDLGNTYRMYAQSGISGSWYGNCPNHDTIETDADAAGGQSGSPLWQLDGSSRYLFGVLAVTGPEHTYAAGGQSFLTAVANARTQYP